MNVQNLIIFFTCVAASFTVQSAIPPKLNEPLLRAAFTNLKDPDSAKFKNIVYGADSDGVRTMCGEVNAKNSYGGYIGFNKFYASVVSHYKKPPLYFVFATGEVADMSCKQKGL